jgi:hypothetical protein
MKKYAKKSAGPPEKQRSKQVETSPLLYAAVMLELGVVELPDPYLPTMKSGKFELAHVKHRKGTVLDVIDWRTAYFAGLEPARFTLPRTWTEMILKSNGERYRSTDLTENFGQKYAIDHAHGDVLICGLGIGFMLNSLQGKARVTSVTCVEPDNDLIGFLSGSFPNVQFVNKAIHDFMDDRNNTTKFDFVFFDVGGDSIGQFLHDVVPFRARAKQVLKSPPTRNDIVCWNEEIMRGQIIRNIMGEINAGFDIRKLSFKELTKRQGLEPVVMDFFAKFGVVAADERALAKVTQFVREWET